jgi:hypothetical protein
MSQKMELDLLEFAADSTPILTSSGPSLILDISGNQGPVNLHLGDVSSISHQDRLTPSPSPSSLAETELALRRAFEAFASRLEAVQLKSNLDQLKDESSSRSEKTSAGQRISGFLYKVAGKIGSEAVSQSTKMMLDYVASLVGPQ